MSNVSAADVYLESAITERRRLGSLADRPRALGVAEDFAMTIEIIYLTARIHHWLNVRVARHLAAQARKTGPLNRDGDDDPAHYR